MLMDVVEIINFMSFFVKIRLLIETLVRFIVFGLCLLKEKIGILLIKYRIESLISD